MLQQSRAGVWAAYIVAVIGGFAALTVASAARDEGKDCAKSQTCFADNVVTLQSTTSTENSGLLRYLLPKFKEKTGVTVRVVAVGTGQAIKNAMNGDGDALLVHAKTAEEKFVADGWGVERFDVMYNDFVIVGPKSDPAGIEGSGDVAQALKHISEKETLFLSRGDDSGTHKAERRLWAAVGIDPAPHSGKWYREAGAGMGATINAAIGMDAYVLSDRATWMSFQNKAGHKIVFEGDPKLFNQYGVIKVNPDRHARANAEAAQAFIDWLLSKEGQQAIAAFKVNGQQLFFPNAKARADVLAKDKELAN